MVPFLNKHREHIAGVLSGFDRLIFRGYLRGIAYPKGMEAFLYCSGVLLKNFKSFAHETTELIKAASLSAALLAKRPIVNLPSPKEDKHLKAVQIAQTDGITDGLICVFKTIETCWSFSVKRDAKENRLVLERKERKCQYLYHYFQHRKFRLDACATANLVSL